MDNQEYLYNLNVSQKKLLTHIENIAQWSRIAGSEEEKNAFNYLKDYLSSIGAEVKLLEHDAYISVPNESSLEIDGATFTCRGHSMSPSTKGNGLKAELVYYHELSDHIDKKQIYGKIIMVDGKAMGGPVKRAQELGASGIIFISGEQIHEMCISNIWGSPSIDDKDQLPTIPAISITCKSAEKIKGMLEQQSIEAVIKTSVTTQWRKIPILIADVKSVRTPDKFVMFSAHVDSWYYGATDNGIANSILLEVGRLAIEHRDKLQRSLRLVFYSGHSQGRYAGSSWYADNYWDDLYQHCFMNIDLDVLGFNGAEYFASAIMPEAEPVVSKAVRKLANCEFHARRYNRFADQSFWSIGITSALASFSRIQVDPQSNNLELGWWWHTPDDTLDKVSPKNMLRDARILAAIVFEFCTSSVIPLDYRLAVKETLSILKNLQQQLKGKFNLQSVILKAEKLQQQINILYDTVGALEGSEIEAFNSKLLKLSRLLIPLNYTYGNIYKNDWALPVLPMPTLDHCKLLIETNDENTEAFIKVALIRRRNYVSHTLDKAILLTE